MRVAVEESMSTQLRQVAFRRTPGKQCTVHPSSIDLVQVRDLDALQKLHAQHLCRHRMVIASHDHHIAWSSHRIAPQCHQVFFTILEPHAPHLNRHRIAFHGVVTSSSVFRSSYVCDNITGDERSMTVADVP